MIRIATPATRAVFLFSYRDLSPVRLANIAIFPIGFVMASIAIINVTISTLVIISSTLLLLLI